MKKAIALSVVIISIVVLAGYLYLRKSVLKVLGAEINIVYYDEPPDESIMEDVE